MIYTKYDASGNDFVIFHTDIQKDYSQLAIKLCDRKNGIGADGLIVIVPHKQYDFQWLFYNSDGSEASMCGNGTRACAHYAYNHNLALQKMRFLTGAGVIECEVDEDIVQTSMTKPIEIKKPFEDENLLWWQVDTGVPHLVTIVDNLELFDLNLCATMRYRYDANVNFAMVKDNKLYVRTYERGVEGETLACGTGMVASFLRALELNLISPSINVYPKSGEELTITKTNDKLLFKGKVIKEFEKEI
jgi:diaminopimelate epimerase